MAENKLDEIQFLLLKHKWELKYENLIRYYDFFHNKFQKMKDRKNKIGNQSTNIGIFIGLLKILLDYEKIVDIWNYIPQYICFVLLLIGFLIIVWRIRMCFANYKLKKIERWQNFALSIARCNYLFQNRRDYQIKKDIFKKYDPTFKDSLQDNQDAITFEYNKIKEEFLPKYEKIKKKKKKEKLLRIHMNYNLIQLKKTFEKQKNNLSEPPDDLKELRFTDNNKKLILETIEKFLDNIKKSQ